MFESDGSIVDSRFDRSWKALREGTRRIPDMYTPDPNAMEPVRPQMYPDDMDDAGAMADLVGVVRLCIFAVYSNHHHGEKSIGCD